jgi:hypothetical protein
MIKVHFIHTHEDRIMKTTKNYLKKRARDRERRNKNIMKKVNLFTVHHMRV